MTTILDTLKNTADEEKAATALAAFARENPEALETIIKANQLFWKSLPRPAAKICTTPIGKRPAPIKRKI